MKVIATENKPIKMWLDNIEDGALDQAKNLANLPFTFKHVALMPDCHQGFGMPIGGVLATKDVVIPNAVGVDIGCGMCAVKTSTYAKEVSKDSLKKIMGLIREAIPVGFSKHKEKQSEWRLPIEQPIGVSLEERENSLYQLGTLGTGNHFIELQKDQDDYLWIMLHSGSRNLGYKVAQPYNNLAKSLNEKWHSAVPKEWDLAFLPLGTQAAQDYMHEMTYCVNWAYANRKLMMDRIMDRVHAIIPTVKYDLPINIAHNYASTENHFNTDVVVHRKGATAAYKDQLGIIPGSQGTSSYIVKGKGNPLSFMSCSHGAGRKMGRKQAQRELNLEEQVKLLDDAGVIHSIRGQKDLDEAPGSYKDINEVMANQEDLVEIVKKLSPLAVIKG